jgi:hypothetical protein
MMRSRVVSVGGAISLFLCAGSSISSMLYQVRIVVTLSLCWWDPSG